MLKLNSDVSTLGLSDSLLLCNAFVTSEGVGVQTTFELDTYHHVTTFYALKWKEEELLESPLYIELINCSPGALMGSEIYH